MTVETAPDTGTRLRSEVEGSMDPDAPEFARAMLSEVVDSYPVGSATIRAYIASRNSSAGKSMSNCSVDFCAG